MNNSFFAFLSRMKYINRWGLMHNSRYENLSEHSFETACIANALANIENEMFGGGYNAERITTKALYHDCAEILTGDLPTPVKYKTEQITAAYAQIERSAKKELLSSLPENLYGIYNSLLTLSANEQEIIKAADKLSALIKCRQELAKGNTDFKTAEKTVQGALKKSKLKSVDYFMREILPLYTNTLDELSK